MPFDPKNILVTGATSEGIGKALALALLDLPSQPNVIITGRRQEKLDEICKGNSRLHGRRLDQTAPRAELQKWTQQLLSDFPDIDMVVLNAGIQHNMDFLEAESIDFEAVCLCFPRDDLLSLLIAWDYPYSWRPRYTPTIHPFSSCLRLSCLTS
jgi:short-subunit dehydrogenase involved in D-alanine esterification of teichoic acids